MTLRARLIATLFVLTTVAMLVLATVTYTAQRSALLEQVDGQLRSAAAGVSRELDRLDGRAGNPLPLPGGPVPDGDDARGPSLPPGTYGESRDAAGRRVGKAFKPRRPYGSTAPAPAVPKLPAVLHPGSPFTVEAVGDDDLRYRVQVVRPEHGPGFATGTNATATLIAIPLTNVDETLSSLVRTEALVIAITLALLIGLAWVIVRIGLRPLDRMAATAGAIAAGDLDRRVDHATPKTEVGRLGLALNGMLERLERAFAEREASEGRLRQFLSDASHELRTPLASIRGYAELFRVGAVREPADVQRAMGRIEDEAARMGTLVEDLLVLARLDEAPEKATAVIDVALLAEDAVEDAHATDPARPIEIRTDGEALVRGNDGQLRQVLANLLRNALVHTPEGTPIEVRSRHDDGHVELEVRDHGPGLPGDDPDALFDRFWRAEGGRARGRSGAGLGLAIVAAVVAAHDGQVRAANAADGGASFVVRLPLVAPAVDGGASVTAA